MDGRPADIPGHAVGGRSGCRTRPAAPARCPSGTSDETAQPHHYGVTFDNGLKTEIAPTDHAALAALHLPRRRRRADLRQRQRQRRPDPRHRTAAWSPATPTCKQRPVHRRQPDVRLRASSTARHRRRQADRRRPRQRAGLPRLRRRARTRTVTLRIATSLISVDAGKDNLELEIRAGDTFEKVKARAQAPWDAKLGVDRGRGRQQGPADHALLRTCTGCSCIPNSGFENTGTHERAGVQASPCVSASARPEHPHRTPARRSWTARCTSTTASGTPTARPGPRTRCSPPRRPARWSTASSSSTRTAAGSRAGPRRATPT